MAVGWKFGGGVRSLALERTKAGEIASNSEPINLELTLLGVGQLLVAPQRILHILCDFALVPNSNLV